MALAKVIDTPAIKKLAVEENLYKKYQYCMPSDKLVRHYTDLHIAARQCGAKVLTELQKPYPISRTTDTTCSATQYILGCRAFISPLIRLEAGAWDSL